jgi:radical SAM superfamily enzyme YgiQ (UPF0313 family)
MILINSSTRDTVRIFQKFYPIHPPVGIGYLASFLEQQEIKVKIIDEQIEADIVGRVKGMITESTESQPPYIFGFSVLTAAFKNALSASEKLKEIYPDSVIVFGGHHPTAMPEEVLSYSHIDAVIRGEAEQPLAEFYRCVKARKDWSHISNLSYSKNGKIIHNDLKYMVSDLDKYPSFPYHLFKNGNYDLGFVFSSRGCPYQCIFCSCKTFPGSSWYRYRSEDKVISDIEMLLNNFGITSIIFVDDNFLVNKNRIYKLINGIKEKGISNKVSFTFQARSDNVERNLLKQMHEVGFNVILFGLETASETVMKAIKKGETVAQSIKAVRMAKEIGLMVGATFIFGLPKETHEDRMNCLKMSKKLQLDVVRYNNAIPYPGTELYDIAKEENNLRIEGIYENFVAVATMTENPFKRIPLAYVSRGNKENQIRRDILLAFFITHFNIMKLIKTLILPARKAKWLNIGNNLKEMVYKIPSIIYLGFMLLVKFMQLIYYVLVKKETRLSAGQIKNIFKKDNDSNVVN